MINFNEIEKDIDAKHDSFVNANPFPHIILDNFCDQEEFGNMIDKIPTPGDAGISKSRDYVFAKNKFEKSNFREFGNEFEEIFLDLTSDRFKTILSKILGRDVFVDDTFHGGGLHQGGAGSFLDMHADFNFHPENKTWFRDINILVYMNKNWKSEYKGSLKLVHRDTKKSAEVEPLFNRCVIMETRDVTLHGYDKINFPEGMYRRTLATYAYHYATEEEMAGSRSTVWYPENSNAIKSYVGKIWPTLVRVKGKFLGSGTSKNQ